MTPKLLLVTAIDPAHALLEQLVDIPATPQARLLSLAIAGQESAWIDRRQLGGPARGFWQFEGGPMSATAEMFRRFSPAIQKVCGQFAIPCDVKTVFEAIAWHDVLAASMARLLLWSDAQLLPELGDLQGSWNYYQRNWKPGAPRPDDWPGRYGTAMGLVQSTETK